MSSKCNYSIIGKVDTGQDFWYENSRAVRLFAFNPSPMSWWRGFFFNKGFDASMKAESNKRKLPFPSVTDHEHSPPDDEQFQHEYRRAVRLPALAPSPIPWWRGFLRFKGVDISPKMLMGEHKHMVTWAVDRKHSPPRWYAQHEHHRAVCLSGQPLHDVLWRGFLYS